MKIKLQSISIFQFTFSRVKPNKGLSKQIKIIKVCFSSKARKASITLPFALCTLHFI